jgi:antitoxin component YwqK of YwqJK toxin-antitoxin module
MRVRILACSVLLSSAAAAEVIECPRGTELQGGKPPQRLKEWCALPDGTQHGPSVFYDRTGARRVIATFSQGRLDGHYQRWHDNDQLAEEGDYRDDVKYGLFRSWRSDGSLLQEERYENGELTGEARSFFPDGKLMATTRYEKGKRHGLAVVYYENGQKRAEGKFRDDLYHGVWKGWYEDGSLEKRAEFDEGREIERERYPRD